MYRDQSNRKVSWSIVKIATGNVLYLPVTVFHYVVSGKSMKMPKDVLSLNVQETGLNNMFDLPLSTDPVQLLQDSFWLVFHP